MADTLLPPLEPPAGNDVFLGRQPILDREQQIVAYELLFRDAQGKASFSDDARATAEVITRAFGELSLGDVLGPYKAYINVPAAYLESDAIELLPAEQVVLEIQPIPVEAAPMARMRALRAKGFSLALGNVASADEAYLPLLKEVDILKVDHKLLDNHQLFLLACHLKPLGKQLLAEKIEDRVQMEHCHDLGFHLFQGYYFARPTVIAGKKLGHSEVTLLKLLGLILEDADTPDLERIFKQEPGLTMNLLRLTNSIASGLAVRIGSLRHAITLLGRRQLQRWLQLLLYTNAGRNQSTTNPLLITAAIRGRFMELMQARIQASPRDLADRAFMTGILSLMPVVIGLPMAELLAPLPLAPDVRLALLEYKGDLGRLLQLTEALEQDDGQAGDPCASLSAQLGLRAAAINECLSQALAWANNLARDTQAA